MAKGAFNLAIVHLPSKVNWGNPADTDEISRILASDILDLEDRDNHRRTIVIGDFNMNPFENGMVMAGGLHATMDRGIATKGSRTIYDRDYPFFYNPMWAFFGTKGKGPMNGTHYYNTGTPLNYFWNLYDQVLIRPELLEGFDEDTLEIITSIGTTNLTKHVNGEIRVNDALSDHLPITFAINI